MLTAAANGNKKRVVYPIVKLKLNVEGILCRAHLDTGAGSSYASAALLDKIPKRTRTREVRRIKMMLWYTTRQVELSSITVQAVDSSTELKVDVTKVDRNELLMVDTPNYKKIIESYAHLQEAHMDDSDSKPHLPVYLILGASEYAAIKNTERPRIGRPGEPVAEKTKLGWTIVSPGREIDHANMLLTQTNHVDYEELCRLDVLGLEDSPEHDQQAVYPEFREQLTRNPEGWYETSLPWKGNHPPLPNNKAGNFRRLVNLRSRLQRMGLTEEFGQISDKETSERIVEEANESPQEKEFYIPLKSVARIGAESTKLRVVDDASARSNPQAPSLNDSLHCGPPLEKRLWNVLVCMRFHPVLITGDLKQAFLPVCIKKQERDALRFHWKANEHLELDSQALFGLVPSHFLLEGVIESHLEPWEPQRPDPVVELRRSLYVRDLISGKPTVKETEQLKQGALEVFEDATFTLHKLHSNAAELEENETKVEDEESFAKQQLRQPGLSWDKGEDKISVVVPREIVITCKRGIVRNLAKIYDPLGLQYP